MKKLQVWTCLTLLLIIAGCKLSDNKEAKNEEKFLVTHPEIIDTVYYHEYLADIHAVKNVEIRARVHGEIEKIHVDEGQPVKKGQILFSIDDLIYKEELSRAKAQLKNSIAEAKAAEVDLINAKILVEKNVVSKTELERAESKYESLRAKIEEAESHQATALLKLSFTQVRAPFDGVLDRIPLKAGSLVEEGTLLTTISDHKEVFAYFKVSENEYLNFVLNPEKVSKKSEVSLLLANGTSHPYSGKVETIESVFDKSTGSISFRARFPNPESVLKHGASGKIKLKNILQQAMVIPQKSTFEIQEKVFVYVIDQNNIVHIRSVIPSLRLPHLYVIESGLTQQDKIIYEGIQRVKEGDKIIPEVVFANKMLSQQTK